MKKEYLKGEKEMKNKLNASNLMNTYYDNGLYELEFGLEGKKVFVRIKEEDHEDAKNDEWYFDNNEVIEEIIKNADEEDIEIKEK